MIDKICNSLTNRIRKEMPDVDDERAEVINYGLQLLIGEIPKTFIILFVAYILGIFRYTLLMVLIILPYRAFSGGFHLKTHIGCVVSTTLYYCGVTKISNCFILYNPMKLILILCVWIFGTIMSLLYAPADTENVPILRKKERIVKKILSVLSLTVGLAVAWVIENQIISNIIILSSFIQSIMITPIAYLLTKNKYGYKIYKNTTSEFSSLE